MPDQTRVHEGQLTVNALMADKPVTVQMGTPLPAVAKMLSRSRLRHVLVNDNEGRLVGVVSSEDLLCYMSEAIENPSQHSTRAVESLMTNKFLASTPDADVQSIASMMVSGPIQCMPVLEGDRLVGVLTPDDFLMSWNRINPVLREAAQDCVTDLPTRSTLDRRLQEEWERARRSRGTLSMVMVDLDHFKEINDTCGHQAGDAVLQMVGSCLRRTLREYDVVARFGGDEFAAICVDCDVDKVVRPVQRLQRGVRNLSVPTAEGRRDVTVSIGVVVIRDGFENHSPHDLISFADACLYEAKRAGRDQAYLVEISPHQKPTGPIPIQASVNPLPA